jgi:folate-binding protein YgfZ
LEAKVSQRLDRYIIADDVQVIPIGEAYGVLTVQGQRSEEVLIKSNLSNQVPGKRFESIKIAPEIADDIYVVNQSRFGTGGYDIFVPAAALLELATKLLGAVRAMGGRLGGWDAMEMARIEAGIPRFGADMDETTIPLEAGLEARAISFNKGCYIGQEVISRIKTYGQVTKRLRRLKLTPENTHVPQKRDKLFCDGKEVGYVTSAVSSAKYQGILALGYVRKEVTDPAALLEVRGAWGSCLAGWEELS